MNAHRIEPFALFLFALVVRALYFYHISEAPYFDHIPEAFDQHNFYAGAKAFARGDPWAPSGNEMYSALYKYALGLLWWGAGGGDPDAEEYRLFALARGTHLLFGAIASLILYFEASRYFNRRVGILSSVLYTLCGPILFHEALLSREFPAVWLSLASFALLGRLARKPTLGGTLAVAAALSLTYQCRTNAILFLPFAAGFAYFQALSGKPPLRRLAWIAAGALLFVTLCLPLAWRNSVRLPLTNPHPTRSYFTVSAQGPFEVAMGNHPDLTVPGFRPTPEANAYMEEGPLTFPGMAGRILRWAWADPVEFARLQARKLYWFFSDYEVPDNHSFYIWRHFSPLLSLPTSRVAPLAALALAGAVWAWPDRRRLSLPYGFALAASLSVILTYVCSRFRIQAIPFWIPFAALAIERTWETFRARGFAKAGLSVVTVAVLARAFALPEPDGVARALGITERHFPEAMTGEVLLPPRKPWMQRGSDDWLSERERPYVQTGVNRPVDYPNLLAAALVSAERAGARGDSDRANRLLASAERHARIAWRWAESLDRPEWAPRDMLEAIYAAQWNAAAGAGDATAIVRAGEKLLRVRFGDADLQFAVARLRYETLLSRDRAGLDAIAEVEARFRAALLVDPSRADGWAALAHLAILSGQTGEARAWRDRLAGLKADHAAVAPLTAALPPEPPDLPSTPRPAEEADRLEQEGDDLWRAGDRHGAAERYARATRIAFDRSTLHRKLAAFWESGDPGRGLYHLEVSLLVTPEEAAAHLALGKLLRQSDPLRAVWHLTQVRRIAPDHPMIHLIEAGIRNWPANFRPL